MFAPKGVSAPSCSSFPHTYEPAHTRNIGKSHEPTSPWTNFLFLAVRQRAGMLHTGLRCTSHPTPAAGS